MSDEKLPTSTPRNWLRIALIAGLGFAAGAITIAALPDGEDGSAHTEHAEQAQAQGQVWTCAMHPQVRQPNPGQCPICGMDLIPVESEEAATAPAPNEVVLSERARALARLRTTEVKRQGDTDGEVRLLGRIVPDESTRKTVTAWTDGRIDALKVRTTGERVRAGQVIATLYSPEIYRAHQDVLAAKRQLQRMAGATPSARAAAEATLNAARDRLRLLGVSGRELAQMERANQPARQVPIRTPFSGTVIERLATEGTYVQTGSALYRIANLSRLWVQLDAYESDLARLSVGQTVHMDVKGVEGQHFVGRIEFIDPTVDPVRRTAQVRVEVENRKGQLRPGMFVQATVETGGAGGDATSPLVVPESAPLFTGRRSIVYVQVPDRERPTYEARTVRLGPKLGSHYPVVAGLREGERVVTRGAFVLDADLQIRGGDSMMSAPDDTQLGPGDGIIELSAASREQLAPVMRAYLALQKGLSEDDLDAARNAAEELSRAAQAVELEGPAKAKHLWQRMQAHFTEHARALVEADTLEIARGQFEMLSQLAQRLLASFGNPLDQELWVAFCPMAMGSEGAAWVQQGAEIHNSYFGAKMYDCGELRESVPAGSHMMTEPGSVPTAGGGAP